MTSAYVIVARDHVREQVIGPFDTAAKASGHAFELFGPLEFGCSTKWQVRPLTTPEEAR
jgi:hypothetical protein